MCVHEIWAYTVVRIRVVIFWIMNLEEHNCLHLQDSNIRAHLRDQTTYQTGICLILYSVARRLSLQRLRVAASWNVMAHAQKPDFVFRRNGRVHLNRRGRQFSRLLAADVCASAIVMLDTPCSEVVWRVLAIHSIHQFPLHFPSRASPCAITFQLESTEGMFLLHVGP